MLGKGWFPGEVGGLERYYRQLLEQLPEARGVVVGPAADPDPRVSVVSSHSAPLAARLLAFTRAARREARDADLVDSHFALYALLPLIGCLRRKPQVVHFHGPWADENVAAGDASGWRRLARQRLERAVYSRAQLVIVLTGAFRRVAVEQYGVSPWRSAVLAPGVDVEHFSTGNRATARARLGLSSSAFVVCCVRRLVPRMGLAVLVEAWAQGFGANPDAKLLIAGEGELRRELERDIEARSLGGSVSLLGRISDDELLMLYRAADANVIPSTSFEGFGLVVLEAAACGTPSIVTDAGGLPEAIAGLGGNLTVPAADAGALADRLARAREGEVPSREQSRAWAEDHAWSRVAEAHRKLLSRVISGREETPRRLRVVYLDHVAELSGGELALLRLVRVLPNVEAHVILAEEGPLLDLLLRAGISAEVLPMPSRTRELRKGEVRAGRVPLRAMLDTVRYATMLAWRLRRLRPDIVHTNSLKSGLYGSIAGRLAGMPVVWYLHDRIDTDYLPRFAVALVRMFIRSMPRVVISNSETTRQTVRRRERSLVIPPVAVVAHPDSKARCPDSPMVVGMIGRLAPWKGQDVFLRAFAQAFPNGSQRAVIVGAALFGEGEVEYGTGLHRLATGLGIAERVEFRGHRDDIARELRAMDVLVHASTTAEPFGQVVVEGMAARLPVVAARGGGPEEIVTDGVDGLLYAAGDVGALAQILGRLDADSQLRARLGQAAAVRARDFLPELIAEQMMKAYGSARRGAG